MDLRTGDARLGDYVLERELGSGGMGTVYLARDERLDRLVAVKVVASAVADDERFRERFLRESRLAARLEHPAIVPVYQAGEDGGRLFLAMRYLPDGTLAARLAGGRLEPMDALRYLTDVATALDAAHEAGLVHRDVKPGNILLDHQRALLADFGLAQTQMSPDSLTRDGFTGTVGYVAPEQIEGEGVTGAADQYALACVAFECLTGKVPFVRDSDLAAVYAHLSEQPPKASAASEAIPVAADAVLARGLAKRPADRFPNCEAFVSALREAVEVPVLASRQRTRRVIIAAAAVVAIVAAAAGIALHERSPSPPPVAAPDALVTLDPQSGSVREVVPLGNEPTAVTTAPDGVWVALPGAYEVVRVDPKTREITEPVRVPGPVAGIAAAAGSIWATLSSGRDLLRIDPDSATVAQTIDVANGPGAIVAADGSLWIASLLDGDVTEVSPTTGKPVRTIPIGAGVTDVIAAFNSVWATSEDLESVTRIDPASGTVTATIPVGHAPTSLAAADGAIWVANRGDGTITRIDPATDSVVATRRVGQAPGTAAAAGRAVLVGDDSSGTIYRVSGTESLAATPVAALHATAADLVPTPLGVLATTTGLPSSHRGGVLRIADLNTWWPTDPAMDNSNPPTWVWDTLIRYRRTGGAAGYGLVPDLAASIPRPTDGGRTYTFQVRPHIRYSTGTEVLPSDFVREFNRLAVGRFLFIPEWTGPTPVANGYAPTFAGIVGFQACLDHPAACDLSKGIVADDAQGTLTFHLTQPDDNFIRSLTLTPSAPVPPGTVVNGSWRLPPVPGTGPYVITSQVLSREMIEKRNPYFRVWSPDARPDGNPDEIDWLLNRSREQQIALILSGKADGGFTDFFNSEIARVQEQHPSQVFATPDHPGNNVGYVFDIRKFPLSSVDVRRAINYAIDRPAFLAANPLPALATCQTVRIGVAGYLPYCPYASGGVATGRPDLAKARALVRRAGATGAKFTIGTFHDVGPDRPFRRLILPAQRELLATLRAIGLVPVPQPVDDDGNSSAQMVFAGSDYDLSQPPAADDTGNVIGGCDPDAIAHGAFCDAETKRLLAAANAATDPIAAARAWERLDHYLTDMAAWLPIGSGQNVVVVSKRTHNYAQQDALQGSLWELLTVH
jgi:YVTN family beta-propeller protein